MSQQTTVYHYILKGFFTVKTISENKRCYLLHFLSSLFGIHNKNTSLFLPACPHLSSFNAEKSLFEWLVFWLIRVHLFSSAISAIVCMKNKRWTYLWKNYFKLLKLRGFGAFVHLGLSFTFQIRVPRTFSELDWQKEPIALVLALWITSSLWQ